MPKSFNVTPNGIKAKYPITIGENLVREGNVYISKSESKNTSDSTNNEENESNSGEQSEDKSGIDSTNVMERIEEKLPKEKKKKYNDSRRQRLHYLTTVNNHIYHTKIRISINRNRIKDEKEEMAVILSSLINNTKDKPLQKVLLF